MFSGYGWCRLSAPRPPVLASDETALEGSDETDELLWSEFRRFMSRLDSQWIEWQLHDYSNNDTGVLTFSVSRNHRRLEVFEMLEWIARYGPASHGLLYVHDDEDEQNQALRRGQSGDFSNVYRVHRLLNGEIAELSDPFFGQITPGLRPD